MVFLRLLQVLISLTLPSVGLEFLRWTVSLPFFPLLPLQMGAVILVSWVSAGLAVSVPFQLFSSCQPFVPGGTLGLVCYFFLIIYY